MAKNEIIYILSLDGKPYAKGWHKYISQVITDYLSNIENYGLKSAEFKIKKYLTVKDGMYVFEKK